MKNIQTHSPEETEACGARLAEYMISHPDLPPFIALFGDLGVGKTGVHPRIRLGVRPGRPGPLPHLRTCQ